MTGTAKKKSLRPSTLALILFILLICFNPFVIVNAGERGVILQFGEVKEKILGEGLHAIIPVVNTVKKLSVRIQKHEISAEASSKDLQEVFTDVALNWHIIPETTNITFQQIGNENEVIDRIINPAVEEVLKAVMAQYTAEEIITNRGEVKAAVDELLTARLANYYIAVDDISLVHVHFSERFRDAVEAKQIAEQEAKKAGFITIKTLKQAEATVNLARGEAEAYRLLHETLTPDILHKEMINKWDGNLPLIISNDAVNLLDLDRLIQASTATRK
jgi:regulator of protease activity HflC (stomatin/prohibitin superfamily)